MEIGRAAVIVLLMAAGVQGGEVKIEKDVALSPAGPGGEARPLPSIGGPEARREAAGHRDHPRRRLDRRRQGGETRDQHRHDTRLARLCLRQHQLRPGCGGPPDMAGQPRRTASVPSVGSARMPKSTRSIPTTSAPLADRQADT